jgi:hypothetical protein
VADYQPKRGKGAEHLTNHLIPKPASYSSNGDTPVKSQLFLALKRWWRILTCIRQATEAPNQLASVDLRNVRGRDPSNSWVGA